MSRTENCNKAVANGDALCCVDPDIAKLVRQEWQRQNCEINLIASENVAPLAILQTLGSVLVNKYAEGYPAQRYYAGCELYDDMERLAIERAQQLFAAAHANVQPHSGSSANLAAYLALLQPSDTILAMRLDHGGHLTHGARVNFSGRLFNVVHYGVSRHSQRIDYDEVLQLAQQHRPKLIIAGASAYPRRIDFGRFADIAAQVDAKLLVDMAHIAGLVAAGVHPSPLPHAHVVTSTTHKTLRGPRGGLILCRQELGKAIDKQIFPGCQGGPLMQAVAAKAVCFYMAARPAFRQYQQQVIDNARALAAALQQHGLSLVSGGTDNHLLLIDLHNSEISGQEAEAVLSRVGLVTNKNGIPFDPKPPRITSGIRLGTPGVTSRGMKQQQMQYIADYIATALTKRNEPDSLQTIAQQVRELAVAFPAYTSLPDSGCVAAIGDAT
ncbi:MAG: serine hydroxymethyltransferase [Myxococcota bacterium]